MIREGQIVLFAFPQTDQASGILQGTIGFISDSRLEQIRRRIAGWIIGSRIPTASQNSQE